MTSGGESDDKVVVDAAELEPVGQARSGQTRPYRVVDRVVDRRDPVPLGRGTRDQPAFSIDDLPDDLSHDLRLAPAAAPVAAAAPAMAPALAAALVAPRTTPRATAPIGPAPVPPAPSLPPIPPLPIAEPPVRARSTRDFETTRDPVEVLRMWPHTLRTGETIAPQVAKVAPAPAPSPAAPPVSTAPRRIEDKVMLAHLALDLYRELETDVQGAHVVHTGADTCNSQACEARVNALRGGLVEACLLVQRVALLTPVAKGALEDHVRSLMLLLQQ